MSLYLHLVPVTEVNEGTVTKVRATTKETGIQMIHHEASQALDHHWAPILPSLHPSS